MPITMGMDRTTTKPASDPEAPPSAGGGLGSGVGTAGGKFLPGEEKNFHPGEGVDDAHTPWARVGNGRPPTLARGRREGARPAVLLGTLLA